MNWALWYPLPQKNVNERKLIEKNPDQMYVT